VRVVVWVVGFGEGVEFPGEVLALIEVTEKESHFLISPAVALGWIPSTS